MINECIPIVLDRRYIFIFLLWENIWYASAWNEIVFLLFSRSPYFALRFAPMWNPTAQHPVTCLINLKKKYFNNIDHWNNKTHKPIEFFPSTVSYVLWRSKKPKFHLIFNSVSLLNHLQVFCWASLTATSPPEGVNLIVTLREIIYF